MADNKEFGTLLMGVVVIGKSRGDKDYIGWRGRKKEAGGGVLMMNAVHYINILRWIFGDILEVKGEVSTLTHNIGVEDAGGVLIKFKNGAIGIIAATTSLPFNIADRVEVYGSKCSLIIEGGRITKSYRKNRAYSTLSSNLDKLRLTRNGKIQEQITNFISFLNGKEKLEINGEEGVKDLEIIEKIYKES